MIRNIEYLFGLSFFTDILQNDGALKAHLQFLLNSGGQLQVPRLQPVPNISASDQTHFYELTGQILSNRRRKEAAAILALIFSKEILNHAMPPSFEPHLQAYLQEQTPDFAIPRLFDSYDERFLTTLVAGWITTSPEARMGVSTVKGSLNLLRLAQRYLIDLATNGKKADSERSLARQIHDMTVRIVTDPSPIFPGEQIDDYLFELQGYMPFITKGTAEAVKAIRKVLTILENSEKISPNELLELDGPKIYYLLVGLKTTIELQMDGLESKTLEIGLASAVDLLYGSPSKYDIQSWIKYLLERAGIQPEQVSEIGPYRQELNLTYTRRNDLSPIETRKQFIEYLANRFKSIFDMANALVKMFEALSNFDTGYSVELDKWTKTGRLPMVRDNLSYLPIYASFNDMCYRLGFNLEDRLVSRGSWKEKNTPLLQPVRGISDPAKEVILNIFFDRVVLNTQSYRLPSKLFLLRPHEEMLDHLAQLPEEDKSVIEPLDFLPYLESMGYPNLELASEEYQGYAGLQKVTKFHSLAHLNWGVKSKYPFYYSGLVREE